MDSSGTRQEQVAGSCRRGNETSCFTNYRMFLDWLWGKELLKNYSVPWSKKATPDRTDINVL